MANRTLRVLLKKIYTDGSIDTIYLKSRASDVFLDGSSIDTLDTIVTKVNGIQAGATAVSSSATNGYISINGTATQVYAHPNSGVTPGTYGTVTVDNSGHIISGSNSDYLLSSSKVTFAEATEKANIVSNSDTIATMLGKLAKWYSSFGSLAWLSSVGTSQLDTTLSTAYNQRVVTGTANTTASVTESREITAAGYVADARAVANLQTQINTINSSLNNKVNGQAFEIVYNDQYNQFGFRINEQAGVVHTINGANYSRVQAIIHTSGRVFVQALPVGETTWATVSEPHNVAIDYSSGTRLRNGPMAIGEYTFTMTNRGVIVVCNMYALTLGTTSDTNNYHMNVYVNNKLVGDSQSYTKLERGGTVYAIVATGDVVKLALINRDINSCDLFFYPFRA